MKPPEHILPHSDFGDAECCGLLLPFERGDFADIICNECGATIQTVRAADLRRTLDEMQLKLDVASERYPLCRSVNLLPASPRCWRLPADRAAEPSSLKVVDGSPYGRGEGAVLGDRAGRDGERGRAHRAASDQEPALQEGRDGHAPQDGRLRRHKVSEVVVNMDRLEEEVAPHAQGVDVALAAFGVGKGSAKMPEEEVRKIEIAYPQAFCRAAKAGGARVCGVMTAAGADPEARMKYAKIIGEKEKVESVKFDAVILGNSNTPGVLGYVMPMLQWAMPSKYHSIRKNDLARAMVGQSEQAFLAIAQGNHRKGATVKILEYKEMEPFFVKGESDEP
jgi:hypothetical protein